MLIKRIYDEQDLARFRGERERLTQEWHDKLSAAGLHADLIAPTVKGQIEKLIKPPLIAGLEIEHTGTQPEQRFSTSLITELVRLGIVTIQGQQLTLRAAPEDLHYTIKREPGRWCLHCGERLGDDAQGELARLHVSMQHAGEPSPDPGNPAGYEWLTYFDCILDAAQHARFKREVSHG